MAGIQQSLSANEFAALKQLGVPYSRGTIVPAMRARLTALGYTCEILGNLTITDAGSSRLADLNS